MSERELHEWAAYYSLEPFGVDRDNAHAAIVAATIANAHRSKRQQPFGVQDFMIAHKRRGKPQTAEEMQRAMRAAGAKRVEMP